MASKKSIDERIMETVAEAEADGDAWEHEAIDEMEDATATSWPARLACRSLPGTRKVANRQQSTTTWKRGGAEEMQRLER